MLCLDLEVVDMDYERRLELILANSGVSHSQEYPRQPLLTFVPTVPTEKKITPNASVQQGLLDLSVHVVLGDAPLDPTDSLKDNKPIY